MIIKLILDGKTRYHTDLYIGDEGLKSLKIVLNGQNIYELGELEVFKDTSSIRSEHKVQCDDCKRTYDSMEVDRCLDGEWRCKQCIAERKQIALNSIEDGEDLTKKGCGKLFCMDCGADWFKDKKNYHNELCQMGEAGWITCGNGYDGDIMLCNDCRSSTKEALSPEDKTKAEKYVKESCHEIIKDILMKDYALDKLNAKEKE